MAGKGKNRVQHKRPHFVASMNTDIHEYTVTELTSGIKKTLESAYAKVLVVGEVSGFKISHSGHAYFALKDDVNNISCTCWRAVFEKLPFDLQDGVSVSVTAKVTAFGAQSRYQLNVLEVRPLGSGLLMQAFVKLKAKLEAEGLFDVSFKKLLPSWPDCIGLVTSPHGAVLWDIVHRIKERFPTRVIVYPVAVQGPTCAAEVIRAIEFLNEFNEPCKPKLIIIARGGGSIEDLWGFNDEALVRAIFNSQIPIISAIGHETDFTLADFVADLRAPTPTAAAEMSTPVLSELKKKLSSLRLESLFRQYFSDRTHSLGHSSFIVSAFTSLLRYKDQRFDGVAERLSRCSLASYRQRVLSSHVNFGNISALVSRRELHLARVQGLLKMALERQFANLEQVLKICSIRLEKVDVASTMARGFALVKRNGTLIKSVHRLSAGEILELEFQDGSILAQILK